MKVRDEIDKFADEAEKPVLHWLFDKYHMESQWQFVAKCVHQRYGTRSYETNRVWSPTEEGWALYRHMATPSKQEPPVFSENHARNACTTAIFMWDGVEVVRNKYPNLFDVWGKGCVELGLELSKFALFSEEELTRRNPDEFPGVYDYEVSNPFGQWFGNQIIERNGATIGEDEAKQVLLDIMDGFFGVVVFDPSSNTWSG